MSNVKSNIRIKSNIYLRSPESLSDGDHPEKDMAFAAQITSRSALEKLKKRVDEGVSSIAFSEVQQRILHGDNNIRIADIKSEIASEAPAKQAANVPDAAEQAVSGSQAAEIPAVEAVRAASVPKAAEIPSIGGGLTANISVNAEVIPTVQTVTVSETAEGSQQAVNVPGNTGLERITFDELLTNGFGDENTAIVCGGYAEYVSARLHEKNISHILKGQDGSPECVRYIADILWDCHDRVIAKDNFTKRFTARCSAHAHRVDECFDALCGFAGSGDGLDIGALAKKIKEEGLPDTIFDTHNGNITVIADNVNFADHSKVYMTENALLSARGLPEKRPVILSMDGCPEIVRGSGCVLAVGGDNTMIGVGKSNTDMLSFIGGNVGDAVRKQAYISQNVKCGDAVRLELNDGVYDVVHGGVKIAKLLAEFSAGLSGEFGGKRYFDSLPKSLDGVIVTNVITVVSVRAAEEFGSMVPPQFRDRNFWLGVELNGFASEI